MKLTKNKTIFTSLFLSLILCLTFLLPSYLNAKAQISTREINVSEIGLLTYEEKAQQLLDKFDYFEISNTDTIVSFEAELDISTFDFSGIQFLSSNVDKTLKKYKTSLDAENEKFFIVTQFIQDDIIVYEETIETTPYYDEYDDDYFIAMPDGENVSLREVLKTDNINECSVMAAALALTAFEAAVLLISLSIVAAPYVVEVVNVVVTTVVTVVKSIWNWFKSLFTTTTSTTTTTTITVTLSYTISISNTKYEAKPFEDSLKFPVGNFYIAIADTDDGLLYVAQIPIEHIAALAILTASTFVNSAHKGSNKKFVLSLYTSNGANALAIASEAGTILGDPGAILHTAKAGSGYFDHYHPCKTYKNNISEPHVFFGKPR